MKPTPIERSIIPGRTIIKAPIKPINIAIQVLGDTFSFKIIADNATTITGASDPILCASAKDKYLKDKTKHTKNIAFGEPIWIWRKI